MSTLVSRHARALGAAAVLGALIAFPLGVLANHNFADVPTDHTFHGDIEAIFDAGVTTTGCGGGNFCPDELVTRGQMAAFLNRLGALGPDKTPVVDADKLDGLDATDFLQNEEQAGQYTCSGSTMVPSVASGAGIEGNMGAYSTGAANVTFRCNVLLPDGAHVGQVDWEVNDGSVTDAVSCNLRRIAYNVDTNSTTVQVMSSAATANADDVDFELLTDPFADNPIIDNANNHYISECTPTATGVTTSVFGVRIHYTVSGVPTP
jgi:hypothetical protein